LSNYTLRGKGVPSGCTRCILCKQLIALSSYLVHLKFCDGKKTDIPPVKRYSPKIPPKIHTPIVTEDTGKGIGAKRDRTASQTRSESMKRVWEQRRKEKKGIVAEEVEEVLDTTIKPCMVIAPEDEDDITIVVSNSEIFDSIEGEEESEDDI
jgi:hypothetical protein